MSNVHADADSPPHQDDTFDAGDILNQQEDITYFDYLSVGDEESLAPLADGVEYLSSWEIGSEAYVLHLKSFRKQVQPTILVASTVRSIRRSFANFVTNSWTIHRTPSHATNAKINS